MFASRQIAVVGALLVGSSVIEPAAAFNGPPWENPQHACAAGWITFAPKEEGDLPRCHVAREWRKCEFAATEKRKPLIAHWCPPSVGTGKRPSGFKE